MLHVMIFLNENGLRREGVVNVCGIVGCGLDRVYTSLKKASHGSVHHADKNNNKKGTYFQHSGKCYIEQHLADKTAL